MVDSEQSGPADPAAISDGIRAALDLDGDVDTIRQYYEGWAADYDRDVGAEQYALPGQVAGLLDDVVRQDAGEPIDGLTINPAPPDPAILDVACGTGLVGQRLHDRGYRNIDGVDLSPAMAERAEARGCYRQVLSGVDITAPLPRELVGHHDIVVVGGLFTVGHVPPSALRAVTSMVRPGGLLLVTTRVRYYEEADYQATSQELVAEGRLRPITSRRDAPYTADSSGHYWAYLVADQNRVADLSRMRF